jgi:anti-sigma B factor antagonist
MTDQPHQPISEQAVTIPPTLTKDNRKAIIDAVLALPRGPKLVVLDCSETRYIDSAGLGALVGMSKQLRERGQEIEMRHVDEDIRVLLDLTSLSHLFLADCKPEPYSKARLRRAGIRPPTRHTVIPADLAPPVRQSGAVRAWLTRIVRRARGEPSA